MITLSGFYKSSNIFYNIDKNLWFYINEVMIKESLHFHINIIEAVYFFYDLRKISAFIDLKHSGLSLKTDLCSRSMSMD